MNEDAALTRRAQGLTERAAEVLDVRIDLGTSELGASLAALESACLTAAECTPAVAALLSAVERLSDEVSQRAMTARARRLTECERGLIRLRELTTTSGLIDGVCDELIRSLGFERTMLARVSGGVWWPWKANAAMFDEVWVHDWIEKAIPLDEATLETRMLSDRRPALVRDTNSEGVAQIVRAAGVRSYVAAPIVPGGQVIGFFHADHGMHGRTCDEADRDMLWTFADGFGHLYERTALGEQLQARTEQVRRTAAGLTEKSDRLTGAELTLVGDDGAEPDERAFPPRDAVRSRVGRFTAREQEVFELVVAGARNSEIAERLAITEGTVKSHVTRILAKLGVENRSQAIASYLGERSDRPGSLKG